MQSLKNCVTTPIFKLKTFPYTYRTKEENRSLMRTFSGSFFEKYPEFFEIFPYLTLILAIFEDFYQEFKKMPPERRKKG